LRPLPHLPASPFTGVDGRLRRGGDTQQQYATLPAGSDPSLSSAAPSWARVVRDGASATSQPPLSLREDFFRLYELCVANGFSAHVAIRSAAGTQEITLSCQLRAPATILTAQAAQRRRHRYPTVGDVTKQLAAATPAHAVPPVSKPSLPLPLRPEHSPPEHPPPASSLTRHSSIPSPPPAKRTRKAVKRRCEAELLRGGEGLDTLLLSPPHGSPPQTVSWPQQRSPSTVLPPRTPPSESPPGPSSPVRATPEPPSPTTAPSSSLPRRQLLPLRNPRLRMPRLGQLRLRPPNLTPPCRRPPRTRTRSRCSPQRHPLMPPQACLLLPSQNIYLLVPS
jgi:hypothetical protein